MAKEEQVKSKRDQFAERLKAKYPDKEFADDEAIYGQINDDYDQYDRDIADRDAEIGKYKENESKLTDMFSSDPRSASMLMGMKDGEDPAIGLMRRFGPEIRDILDDPEKQEELAKAQAEYLERITKEKDLEAQYEKNLAESLQMLEGYQQEKGMNDDEVDALMEEVISVANDMVLGKFSRETLDKFCKARDYDTDVETASQEGEVRGRNAKISEKLRKPEQGDGIAALGGKNGRPGGPEQRQDLGALGNYDSGSNSIWERGNMKRVRR